MNSDFFMQKAIELSIKNINNNGGPFGCVIVKNNKIISEGVNGVTQNNDPTAHAEIVAIRNACTKLNTFDLSGCEMYTSCEPCPMCLSAIYWSHIDIVYYGNSRENAAEIEFDDKRERPGKSEVMHLCGDTNKVLKLTFWEIDNIVLKLYLK